jgi:prolyl-tRNA synthetase
MEGKVAEVARRDTLSKESLPTDSTDDFLDRLVALLDTIQADLLASARKRMVETTRKVDTYEEFKEAIEHGGFVIAHWDGTEETEKKIKEETKATIRCIPHGGDLGSQFNDYLGLQGSTQEDTPTLAPCMVTGAPEVRPVLFARSY